MVVTRDSNGAAAKWRRMEMLTLVVGVAAVVTAQGCGRQGIERVPVAGQVLLDGEPLAHGTIRVEPAGARVAAAKLDREGRFVLTTYKPGDGVPLGTHPVAVNAAEQIGSNSVRWHAPEKYSDATLSGLTVMITGPEENLIVELLSNS